MGADAWTHSQTLGRTKRGEEGLEEPEDRNYKNTATESTKQGS